MVWNIATEGWDVGKKVIQVPIEDVLLGALDKQAQEDGRSRADLIREACQQYLRRRHASDLERAYLEGYRRIPDTPAMGQAQEATLPYLFNREAW